jgi:hypothetical protein
MHACQPVKVKGEQAIAALPCKLHQTMAAHPNSLSRLCACSVRLLSACFSANSAFTLSRKANGICRPKASSATTRYAAEHPRLRQPSIAE